MPLDHASPLCDDRRMTALRIALVPAALLLGWLAYRQQLDNIVGNTSTRALGTLAYAWAFVAAGLVAWTRRAGHRLGPMLVVVGFAMLLRPIRYSFDPLAFTAFYGLGDLAYALFAHAVLAYPTGHVTDRLERTFLKVVYPVVLLFPFSVLLFYDGSAPLRYFDPRPHESLLVASGKAELVLRLQQTYAVVAYGLLAGAFIALLVRRLVRASERTRRILAPLLVAAVVIALRAVFDSVATFTVRPPDWVANNLFWWQVAGLIAVPLALLAGLLRARLARLTVAGLVVDLEDTPPQGIRDALARALDDESLEVCFWLPEQGEFVDADGVPVTLPEESESRAVTRLEHDGHVLAALVHDASLRDEPKLVEAAGAAARLALENARLHAEVQAQLANVRDSRARIVAAGDEQRRRIERDLHDGAQSRLVALALELKQAQRGVADPEVEKLLASTAAELQDAVQQLRELAQGIHPPLLVQSGLAVALEALADRTSVPVSLSAGSERYPPEVESTAYFVASEALANVAKHAHASQVRIETRRANGTLLVEVADDGVGGATPDGGSGLRGLADRVEAQGGRLTVVSPPGGGTRVLGEIPCGS
jgi:signal transduction histidine kinase